MLLNCYWNKGDAKMKSTKLSVLLGCCTALAGIMMSAQAQTAAPDAAGAKPKAGTLQEVVVTAERRSTSVQKAAISITAISGKTLAAEGRYSLRENLQNIVGVSAIDSSSTNSQGGSDMQGNYITIRGVTPNTDPGAGPSVLSAPPTTGVYIDGVYEGIGSSYDIQRVQLERGPQGTLFGRSATSGVYSVYTIDPVLHKYSGTAGIEFGNFSLRHFTGAVNIPLGDVLAMRISADSYRRDGYQTGSDGDQESDGARVKLLYKPSDTISAQFNAAVANSREHNGGTTFGYPAATQVGPTEYEGGYLLDETNVIDSSAPVGSGHNHGTQFWGQFSYNPGFATISFVPTYRTFTQNATQYTSGIGGYNLGQAIHTPLDHFQTYELRVASNEGSTIKWQAGTNFFRNDVFNANHNFLVPHGTQYPLDSNGNPVTEVGNVITSKRTTDYGIFGEATIPVFTGTRVTLGARYDWTTVDAQQQNTVSLNFPQDSFGLAPIDLTTINVNAAQGLSNFKNFNYKVRVDHDLTSHNLVYATVSTGFVPGNVGVGEVNGSPVPPGMPPNPPRAVIYDLASETLTAYEVGSKNRFFDNRLQANLSAYYYDYGGFQTLYTPNPLNPFVQDSIAVPAHNYGFELETVYSITPYDRAGVNLSYDQSHWVNMPATFASNVNNTTLRAGVVPYTLVVNYDHTVEFASGASIDLHGDMHLDGPYQAAAQSTYNLGLYPIFDQLEHVPVHVIGNFNATWSPAGGNYSVTAYVRNIANTSYVFPFQIAQPQVGATVTYTDPRTMGLMGTVKF